MVNTHKTNWHHMVFFSLWPYCIVIKASTGFTLFQLVYGIETVLPIECVIPTFHSAIELLDYIKPLEQRLLQLDLIDEYRRESLRNNEAHKKRVKASFDLHITHQTFTQGELVLCYNVTQEAVGPREFETI